VAGWLPAAAAVVGFGDVILGFVVGVEGVTFAAVLVEGLGTRPWWLVGAARRWWSAAPSWCAPLSWWAGRPAAWPVFRALEIVCDGTDSGELESGAEPIDVGADVAVDREGRFPLNRRSARD
jgi:hypothetical protein